MLPNPVAGTFQGSVGGEMGKLLSLSAIPYACVNAWLNPKTYIIIPLFHYKISALLLFENLFNLAKPANFFLRNTRLKQPNCDCQLKKVILPIPSVFSMLSALSKLKFNGLAALSVYPSINRQTWDLFLWSPKTKKTKQKERLQRWNKKEMWWDFALFLATAEIPVTCSLKQNPLNFHIFAVFLALYYLSAKAIFF